MKRFLSLILVLSLVSCLAGCSFSAEDTTMPVFTTVPPEPTEQPDPYAEQLELIWQEMDSWIQDPYADAWCYAVTDLDGNGRLEIISSDTQGTGHFVTTRILEVNETHTGLTTVQGSGESNSICLTSSYQSSDGLEDIPCLFYADDNVWFYVQESTTQLSATEYAESRTAVSLQNGVLDRIILGTKLTTYPDGGSPTEVWLDTRGEPISQAGYDAALSSYNATAQIRWLECVSIPDLSWEMLDTSWSQFSRP